MNRQPIDGVFVIHELRAAWEANFPGVPFRVVARAVSSKDETSVVRSVKAVLPPDVDTLPVVEEAKKWVNPSPTIARDKLDALRRAAEGKPVEVVKDDPKGK